MSVLAAHKQIDAQHMLHRSGASDRPCTDSGKLRRACIVACTAKCCNGHHARHVRGEPIKIKDGGGYPIQTDKPPASKIETSSKHVASKM